MLVVALLAALCLGSNAAAATGELSTYHVDSRPASRVRYYKLLWLPPGNRRPGWSIVTLPGISSCLF